MATSPLPRVAVNCLDFLCLGFCARMCALHTKWQRLIGDFRMWHGTPRRRFLIPIALAFTATTSCGGRSPMATADGKCGDGVINAIGEYCDGTDLGKLDCAALGFDASGALMCHADCTLDARDCLRAMNQCGDGEISSTEECEDGNSLDGDGCSARCRLEIGNCGDGIVQADEQCDPWISSEHCIDCRYNVSVGMVQSLFANAPSWNDWVTTTEPPQRCLDPAQPTADAVCVHAGELRAIDVAGLTTCAEVFAQDTFVPGGAFEWRCEQTASAIRFISTVLRPNVLLSDLLVVVGESSRTTTLNAFARGGASNTELVAEPAFKSARVDITTPFGTIRGEESVWWDNPVEFFGRTVSSPTTAWELTAAGTIYVLWPGHPNGSIRLGHGPTSVSAVGIVVPRGITLENSTVSPVLDLRQATRLLPHLWIEGDFDAAGNPGLSADNLVYSVLRGLEVRHAGGHGIRLSAGQRNRFEGVVTEENAATGLYLVQEQHSSFQKLVASANGTAGLALFHSADNEFSDITASGNKTDGIVLQVEASRNAFTHVELTDNGLAALRIHEDSCDNAFSEVNASLGPDSLPNPNLEQAVAAITLDSRAARNHIEALTVDGSHSHGISLRSNDNVLSDLTIAHTSGNGIDVADCEGNQVSHASTTHTSGDGIHVADCKGNQISHASISDSGKAGLKLESVDAITVESIDVAASTEHGVTLNDCTANEFSNVTIADSGKDGFSVLFSTGTTVTGLTVQRSAGGGLVDGGGAYGFYSRVHVEDSGADGINVSGGDHATLAGFTVSQSVASGVELGGAGYVRATEGTIHTSGNQGLYLGGGHDHWVSTVAIDASGGSGLEVSGDDRSHFDTIEITDSAGFGVSFGGVLDAQVTNVSVQGSRKAGVTLDGTRGNRILGLYSAHNDWAGLALNGGEFNLVQNVTLTNNGSGTTECSLKEGCSGGLVAFGTNNNVFAQVTSVANDGYGAVFVGSSGNAMLSWTIVDATADGVLLRPSSGSSDSGCQRNTLLGLVSANNGGAGLHLDNSPFNLVGDAALAHNGGDGLRLGASSLHNSFTGVLKFGSNAKQACDTKLAGLETGIDANCQSAVRPNLPPPQLQLDLDLRQSFVGSIERDTKNTTGKAGWPAANTIADWSHFEHPLRAWVNGSEFARGDQRGRCVSQTCYLWDFSLRTTDTRLRAVLSKPEEGGANNVRTQYWYSRSEEDGTASAGCAPLYPWHLREFHGKDSCSPDFWGLNPVGQCAGGRSICATQFLWPTLEHFDLDDNITSNGLCEDTNLCVVAQNIGSYLGHGEPTRIYRPSQVLVNGDLVDVITDSYLIDSLGSVSLYRYPSNGR